MKKLAKYSLGTGDRFARQGAAQLAAIKEARKRGILITPVWNKSHREHRIIGSLPEDVRREADRAAREAGWDEPYFVDADHIGMDNVDLFLDSSDFFTIDVADVIGRPATEEGIEEFAGKNADLTGTLQIEGIAGPFKMDESEIRKAASNFLRAVTEVERVYRHILEHKERNEVVIEVSMDEVENPQTPAELLLILKMLADRNVVIDTIAVKFSGRFNKGIDYAGDVDRFAREFERDLLVIDYAVREFGLPEGLKLSMHTGSDKFSLYGPVHKILKRHDRGIHLKTAGTTWLEELVGLSLAGSEGEVIVKEIFRRALERREELTAEYTTVTDISPARLPEPKEVVSWSGETLANTLRHNPGHPRFNPDARQLLHCAYKVAAELGSEFTGAVEKYKDVIAPKVKENLFERHIKPLFLGG